MTSNWSIIPLTVIGPERNIKSGGVIFSCNTSEDRFIWILKLLLFELPSKDVVTTICSDDNPGLNAAFRSYLIDPEFQTKKSQLNRVICFWHNLSNFISELKRLQIPEDDIKKYIKLFKKMGNSRDEIVTLKCFQTLESKPELKNYMNNNIKQDLKYIAKSMLNGFNCGYNMSIS